MRFSLPPLSSGSAVQIKWCSAGQIEVRRGKVSTEKAELSGEGTVGLQCLMTLLHVCLSLSLKSYLLKFELSF